MWPENWEAIRLFRDFSTQWRVGMNGPVGLDYNPIQHELDRRSLSAEQYDELMNAIRIIEGVAMEELRKD